jgi:hypothetical protein
MREQRNSSSTFSCCALLAECRCRLREACLQSICCLWGVAKVDNDLAHLGLEQQGVCNAAECFLRGLDIGIFEGILAESVETLATGGQLCGLCGWLSRHTCSVNIGSASSIARPCTLSCSSRVLRSSLV